MVERHNIKAATELDDTSSERTADKIRHDIAVRRESITETVDRLSEHVQRKLDWREYLVEYPFASIGLAAGVGFWVAGIFKPRPTPGERILEALSDTVEDFTDRVRGQLDSSPLQHPSSVQSVKVLATSLVAKAAFSFLTNQFSNYTNQNRSSSQYSDHTSREENTVSSSSGYE